MRGIFLLIELDGIRIDYGLMALEGYTVTGTFDWLPTLTLSDSSINFLQNFIHLYSSLLPNAFNENKRFLH
jgi:hypothetical protein